MPRRKSHATRLMAYDCAWKLDQGRDVRLEISMIKAFSTEMAWEVVDHAMQAFRETCHASDHRCPAISVVPSLRLKLSQDRLRSMPSDRE